MVAELQAQQTKRGAGLRILTETITSPTLAAQMQTLLKKFPDAKRHQWQPLTRDNVREGARMAFGEVVEAHYQFEKARVIVALDSDFLTRHPQRLLYTRKFADGRRLASGATTMNRLYVAESTPSITGAAADHRLAIRSSEIAAVARNLLAHVELGGTDANAGNDARARWIAAVASELQKNRGAGIVIVGESQPPIVHALAHQLNQTLGNSGSTVCYSASVEAQPVNQLESLRELVSEMNAGQVDLLLMLGGNPMFTAPTDLAFATALSKVKTCIHLSLEEDETSKFCHWHIPQAHFLETWSDVRAFDGSISIAQPLIIPLYDSHSAHEVLAVMNGQLEQQAIPGSYEIVREHWRQQKLGPDFEQAWRRAVHDGVMAGTKIPAKSVRLRMQAGEGNAAASGNGLEVTFHPDPAIWDGRFANNGWLQELAKPISKLTWDNAAFISPAFADKQQLANGDVIELKFKGRTVRAPVWITPGQAENSIALQLGHGQDAHGPRRHWHRIQCVSTTHLGCDVVWLRIGNRQDGRTSSAGLDAIAAQYSRQRRPSKSRHFFCGHFGAISG